MQKVIAIDLGTTLIKCVLFDIHGKTIAIESLPTSLQHQKPEYAEQNAEIWYTGVCDVIKKLLKYCDPNDVKGISLSSQGISVVPVDDANHPLRSAISWLDVRAGEECCEMTQVMSENSWFQRTGKFISPSYTLPKLRWLQKYEHDLFSKSKMFLLPMDYVNLRMTGRAVTDHTMAAGTMYYNISKCTWDQTTLEWLGIQAQQLAEILPAGTLVGTINEETVQRTGLPNNVQVFNGGQDQKVAAFAAEISDECASLSLGTAGALEVFVENAKTQELLPFFPYVNPEKTLVEGCINTTGAAIQWYKDTLASDLSFSQINEIALQSPIGSNKVRFYPHLGKPGTPHRHLDCYGSIEEVSLGTTRGDLIRSLYEGLAYEIRLNLEYAKRGGAKLQKLIVFGGASKSCVLCQIIADVTKLHVYATANGELGSIGAAKLAIQGLGLDAEQFARAAIGEKIQYIPIEANVAQYDSLYQTYIKKYK